MYRQAAEGDEGSGPVEPAPASNRLGEWTANLIRVSRIQLVIAVSKPTRLGLVIDAAPYASIAQRFAQALFRTLVELGIPLSEAATEAHAMETPQLARSNSRSVLATLNQYAWQVECGLHNGNAYSAATLTRRLAETIVPRPAHIIYPADRAREAFGLPPTDRRGRFSQTMESGGRLH